MLKNILAYRMNREWFFVALVIFFGASQLIKFLYSPYPIAYYILFYGVSGAMQVALILRLRDAGRNIWLSLIPVLAYLLVVAQSTFMKWPHVDLYTMWAVNSDLFLAVFVVFVIYLISLPSDEVKPVVASGQHV